MAGFEQGEFHGGDGGRADGGGVGGGGVRVGQRVLSDWSGGTLGVCLYIVYNEYIPGRSMKKRPAGLSSDESVPFFFCFWRADVWLLWRKTGNRQPR